MKYDVIVVGSGSAGAVAATRLAEDSELSVLLLEAGPDYPDFDLLPYDLKHSYTELAYRKGAPHDWGFVGRATPQQAKPMLVPRAKVVGGCTAHNGPGPNFWRGAPEDYDSWASAGNDRWSYAQVLPYFRKMERDADIQDDYHGSDGPIPVRRHRRDTWLPFQSAAYHAIVDEGFPEHPDVNHPGYTGLAPRVENNVDGVRMSTALTYIDPNRYRLNLTIKPNALVTRVRFAGTRAIGVEVESGRETFLLAGQEIVLCAGAVCSPQLLMLSGVGPADHLNRLGIPVVWDLPGVGQNMRDHPKVGVTARVKEEFQQDPEVPRCQVSLCYTATGSDTRNDLVITPTSFANAVGEGGDPLESLGVGFMAGLYLAAGAGELTLMSSDPKVAPEMDFRYLEDAWDRERMREAVRLCDRLFKHEAFKGIVERRTAPSDEDLASDDSLDAWMLRNVGTSYHVSGTCKMGPASDPMAVVDQYCRVHGLDGLRVVDASIMPDVVRANTNAPTIMIGERATDLIKED